VFYDLEYVLKRKFGYTHKDKEELRLFIEKWIDIQTEDFHSSQKKYIVLCSIIQNKTPQTLDIPKAKNIELAPSRLKKVENFRIKVEGEPAKVLSGQDFAEWTKYYDSKGIKYDYNKLKLMILPMMTVLIFSD
jgi:hypothetical protein